MGTRHRGISRRSLIAGGMIAAGGLSAPAIVRAADLPGVEKELVFGCPGGDTQKQFETKFFPDFYNRTGIKCTYFPGQPAEVLSQLRVHKAAPPIDVVWIGGGFTFQAIDEGLVAQLDRSLIPNADLIATTVRSSETAMTPVGLSPCSFLINQGILQQKKLPIPASWLDMWNPQYKGHVGLYSMNTAAASVTLVMIAKVLTGDYHNVDAAFAKFRELRPNMLNFYASGGAWETALQQGDLWVGVNSAARAMMLKNEGLDDGFPRLKEGYVAYENWMGVVKGAAHPKAAHAWINYMLSTDAQSRMALTIGYNPINREVKPPPGLDMYFPDLNDVLVPDGRFLAKELPTFVKRWNQEIEG